MSEYWLFVMALPLLLIDWQLAIIWVIGVSQASISSTLLSMDFEGFEVFIIFVVVGAFRRLIIGKL